MPGYSDPGFDTLALHAGAAPDPTTGARAVPIHLTTSFVFESSDQAASLFNLERAGHVYSRISNPTNAVLEQRISALEGGIGAIATASGQAALHLAISTLMGAGSHIVASSALYGGSRNPEIPIGKEPAADAGCLLGYVRPEDERLFKSRKIFYFYAIEKPGAKPLDFPIVQKTSSSPSKKEAQMGQNVPLVKYFWGHNKRKTLSWLCEIDSIKLVHASDICITTGRKRKDHKAEYYYLVRWKKDEKVAPVVSVQGLADLRSGKIKILLISELFSRGPVLSGP